MVLRVIRNPTGYGICLFLYVSITTVDASTLVRTELKPVDHPDAICNDGTRAAYYHSQNDKSYKQFVIYLKGGYFCDTVEECKERCTRNAPKYCSAPVAKTLDDHNPLRGGILADDNNKNPSFSDHYKVMMWYCTSDMYIGNRTASDNTGGYHFQGWAVFTALVNSLVREAGLSVATDVILSGTSAGGRGVAFTCPYLRDLLPYSVSIKCIVDAAILYPKPIFENCPHFNQVIKQGKTFWHGMIDNFDVDTWWITFPLPLFIAMQSQDAYAHLYFCIDKENKDHLRLWDSAMTSLARRIKSEAPSVGIFMPSCNRHPMITDDHFFSYVSVADQQLTYSQTLANWLSGHGPSQVYDDCSRADDPVCNPCCESEHTKDFMKYPLKAAHVKKKQEL